MARPHHDPKPALPRDGAATADVVQPSGSPVMRRFHRMLGDAARHDAPVLLLGESGTGKTTFACALHAMSARAARPFVRVDCPAGAGDLAAHAEAARTGTLFLDEVAELPPSVQGTALKLLEDAPDSPQVEVRVVASARHDLDRDMAAGRFRRDLFYRLSVVELRIPALRERSEDILPIARAFLTTHARRAARSPPELSADLERALVAYSWPGNVAELLSVLERATILAHGSALDVDALPERIRAAGCHGDRDRETDG